MLETVVKPPLAKLGPGPREGTAPHGCCACRSGRKQKEVVFPSRLREEQTPLISSGGTLGLFRDSGVWVPAVASPALGFLPGSWLHGSTC
jgi:hypothetical protein